MIYEEIHPAYFGLKKKRLCRRTEYLPEGVRQVIYSYLSLQELFEKVAVLNKNERFILLENALLDQDLKLNIRMSNLGSKDLRPMLYLLRVANIVTVDFDQELVEEGKFDIILR
jgi:hypothetical protein